MTPSDYKKAKEVVTEVCNKNDLHGKVTISNPTHLTVLNTSNYSNVELYDGQGKSAYMLNNTLNDDQLTVLEAGESANYKIIYLTDGDGPSRAVNDDVKWVIQK